MASQQTQPAGAVRLVSPFVVDEIRSNEPGALKNVASGARGYWFERPFLLIKSLGLKNCAAPQAISVSDFSQFEMGMSFAV